jgi:hypothetical protein
MHPPDGRAPCMIERARKLTSWPLILNHHHPSITNMIRINALLFNTLQMTIEHLKVHCIYTLLLQEMLISRTRRDVWCIWGGRFIVIFSWWCTPRNGNVGGKKCKQTWKDDSKLFSLEPLIWPTLCLYRGLSRGVIFEIKSHVYIFFDKLHESPAL